MRLLVDTYQYLSNIPSTSTYLFSKNMRSSQTSTSLLKNTRKKKSWDPQSIKSVLHHFSITFPSLFPWQNIQQPQPGRAGPMTRPSCPPWVVPVIHLVKSTCLGAASGQRWQRNPRTSFGGVNMVYPLVNVYITWKDPPFSMGKSTISMASFNSYLYVYQRVNGNHLHGWLPFWYLYFVRELGVKELPAELHIFWLWLTNPLNIIKMANFSASSPFLAIWGEGKETLYSLLTWHMNGLIYLYIYIYDHFDPSRP